MSSKQFGLTCWGSPKAEKKALLLHGVTSSSYVFFAVAADLVDAGYHVYAADLLGHGRSARQSTYQMQEFADNVFENLGHLDFDLVLGHSLGCIVACHLLPHLSKPPSRVLLVEPPLILDEAGHKEVRDDCNEETRNPPSAESYAKARPLWSPLDCEYKHLSAVLCDDETVDRFLDSNPAPWNHISKLPASGPQVIILGGDPNVYAFFTGEHAKMLQSSHPHIECTIVKGAGHDVFRGFPQAVSVAAITGKLDDKQHFMAYADASSEAAISSMSDQLKAY